jgi:phosphatidate cytidylyltransferase
MKRVATALLAAALATGAVLLLDSLWVFWIGLAVMVGCAIEYVALGGRVFHDLPRAHLLLAVPLVATSWIYPAGGAKVLSLALLAGAPLLFAVLLLPRAGAPGAAVGALGWLSFGMPYLVLPVWSFYELHRISPRLLLLFLVAVWVNDSAAFGVGSAWGRRKLAPRLSPGKTWEGSIGGLLGGAAVAAIGVRWIDAAPRATIAWLLVAAMVAAQLGDLAESMLKRAAAVKDSGSLLPGHGGLLDRLDAIILAAPVFYGLLGAAGLAPDP